MDGIEDPTFSANWASMRAAGVLRGAYQFFEPGDDEVTLANLMVQKVGKLGPGDLPAMIDVEVTGGLSLAPPSARASARGCRSSRPARATHHLYRVVLSGRIASATDPLGAYPIWIAAYGPACPSPPAAAGQDWT